MSRKPKQKSSRKKSHRTISPIPLTVLIIIIVVSIVVAIAFLFSAFTSTESIVKDKISALTKNFYENHLYAGIVNTDSLTDRSTFENTMQKYAKDGFGTIRLRQILHFSSQMSAHEKDFITSYCDENRTYVKIYPESPFDPESYRAEYHYSCNF